MKEALAFAGGARRRRRLSAREEELLGLLVAFPDGDGGGDGSDRELSFSDLVEAGADRPPPSADAEPDVGAKAAPREDDRPTAAASAASKRQRQRQQQQQQAARQRAWRSGGCRGSCGGGGGDGVLLNFYVPGLRLTRSMTTPRPASRGGPPSPGAVQQGAPGKPVTTAATASGTGSRMQAALGIGCWPTLWGRGRRPANACS